jgi:hypothetical protein
MVSCIILKEIGWFIVDVQTLKRLLDTLKILSLVYRYLKTNYPFKTASCYEKCS